jgi:hypothetical protein
LAFPFVPLIPLAPAGPCGPCGPVSPLEHELKAMRIVIANIDRISPIGFILVFIGLFLLVRAQKYK